MPSRYDSKKQTLSSKAGRWAADQAVNAGLKATTWSSLPVGFYTMIQDPELSFAQRLAAAPVDLFRDVTTAGYLMVNEGLGTIAQKFGGDILRDAGDLVDNLSQHPQETLIGAAATAAALYVGSKLARRAYDQRQKNAEIERRVAERIAQRDQRGGLERVTADRVASD